MQHPFESGYAANDPIYDVLDQLRDKRAEQSERWKQFDTERNSLAKAGLLEDDQAGTGRLSELNESYEKASAEVKTLEARLQELGPSSGRSSVRADDPGVQEKAWARAVVSRLIERKALDATTGGTIPPPFYDPILRRLPAGNLFVRSVLPTITASEGDRVSFLRQTTRTNNAAVVAAGGTKPTSVFSVERVDQPYSVIAHLTEAQDRMLLSDYAGLQAFLDQELRLGLLLAEEDEILNGTGGFPHLTGLLDAAANDQPLGSDTISDALLRALNVVRTEGLVEPDAIVMQSDDYENAVLEKTDGSGAYVHGGSPDASPTPTLWGKRVIISPALDAGTALVGSFATGAAIYDREQPRVDFTDGGDLFEKNQVVFRGEERVTLAIFRDAAFCTVSDLTPGP
jgi:HK97 family phage major capsid protein